MPTRKKNVIIVKGWKNLKKGKLYKGVIREAISKKQYAHVVIENLDPTQLSRIHEIDLPSQALPSRYHRTCAFLMACGIDANNEGMEIDLNHIIGTTIGMRFGIVGQDGTQEIKFEKVEKPSPKIPGSNTENEQFVGNSLQDEGRGGREFLMGENDNQEE